MNLISLDDFKTLMQVTDTGKDIYFQLLIDFGSKYLQAKMKRELEFQTFDKYVDGNGGLTMNLEYPVYTVSTLTVDGVDVLADCTLYKGTATEQGFIYNPNGFTAGLQNVHIVYQAGFSYDGSVTNSAKLPEELKYMTYVVLASRAARRGKEALISESKGDVSITFSDDELPAVAVEILERYTRSAAALAQTNNFFIGAV